MSLEERIERRIAQAAEDARVEQEEYWRKRREMVYRRLRDILGEEGAKELDLQPFESRYTFSFRGCGLEIAASPSNRPGTTLMVSASLRPQATLDFYTAHMFYRALDDLTARDAGEEQE